MLHVVTAPELFDRAQWFAATDERRAELARLVGEAIGPTFQFAGFRTHAGTDLSIAVYTHLCGEFSLIPGGGFDMGLSPEEERSIRAAREASGDERDDFDQEFDLLLSEIDQMRPLHRVVVPPLLMAQRVLSVGLVQRWIDGFRDPLYGHVEAAAAHLSPAQIAAVLAGTGLRLPTEAELEYAARGGLHRCLLPTGDRIPDENTLEAMIADTDGATSNVFGVHGYGLYPELCEDAFRPHYKGAPDDGSAWRGRGNRVVRGGAADCYPWQGCGEWNMLLCAFRMNDHAAEFGAAVRLVRGLVAQADVPEDMAEETEAKTGKDEGKKAGKVRAVKKAAANKAPAKKASKKAAAVKKAPAKKASKKTGAAKKAPAKKAAKRA